MECLGSLHTHYCIVCTAFLWIYLIHSNISWRCRIMGQFDRDILFCTWCNISFSFNWQIWNCWTHVSLIAQLVSNWNGSKMLYGSVEDFVVYVKKILVNLVIWQKKTSSMTSGKLWTGRIRFFFKKTETEQKKLYHTQTFQPHLT